MIQLWEQLYWREPLWILLALFPVVIMLWQWAQQRVSLRQYADVTLLPWIIVPGLQKRHHWKQFLQFLIWLFFGLAAAGPRLLYSVPQNLLPPQGAMVMVVDHSRSMQADDVFPNRLQQAHKVVKQWAVEKDEIKKGLVIFSGASHIVLPVTSDKKVLQETILLLDKIQLPTYGTAIIDALLQAETLLLKESGSRAIVLLTDGDVSAVALNQLQQVVKSLQQKNITLHLLGIGESFSTALTDTYGRWLQYNNEPVLTQLKEKELQSLAENELVFYQPLDPVVHGKLSNVWHPESARIKAEHYNDVIWQELFPWFLLPALLLVALNKITISNRLLPAANFMIMVCFITTGLMSSRPVQANGKETIQLAYSHWQNEDYAIAASLYAGVEGYRARMGEGASCFRDKQIECAITAFSHAAWQASTDKQRGQAAFNLGNSFFKQGDFKSAISLYQDALRYQPQQKNYLNNLQFSKEVQSNIKLRLKQEAESQIDARRGSGWKTVDFNNEQISNINVVLGDKKEEEKQLNFQAINLTEEQLALYMLRSQSFAQLKKGKNKSRQRQYDWSRFSNANPVAARKVEYWQRLLELEEGIPAHPDEPKVLPGVQPW